MAGDTDFLVLYEELGLAPGVSDLDALKQAYRRRVAQLHPDRHGADEATGTERLQRLTRLYGAALAFEQRYGRLPAAAGGRRADAAAMAGEVHVGARANGSHERRQQPRARTLAAPRRNRARYYFALIVLLALAFAIWGVGVVSH